MALPNESLLFGQLAQGNIEAFSAIYSYYAPKTQQFIRKIVKSDELSHDLTQDIFIKIWDQREQLSKVTAFHSYLYTISRNASLNFLKRAATDLRIKRLLLDAYPTQKAVTADTIITADYLAYLNRLLNTLPSQSREVFRLCRQEQMTYDEVADELGISRNTVKKHMVRTMKFLGERVERDLGISWSIILGIFLWY